MIPSGVLATPGLRAAGTSLSTGWPGDEPLLVTPRQPVGGAADRSATHHGCPRSALPASQSWNAVAWTVPVKAVVAFVLTTRTTHDPAARETTFITRSVSPASACSTLACTV